MAERKKPRQDGKLLGLSAMSFGNAASAILSFFRFAQITAIFGANWQTDALAVAMVFPILVKDVVGQSFGSAFIPIYSRVMENGRPGDGVLFVNRVLCWIILVGLVFLPSLWFLSPSLVRLVSPNGSPELLSLGVNLLRIMLPIIIVGPLKGMLTNFITYEKRFRILPMGIMLDLTISLGIIMVVRDAIGVSIIPISMLVGALIETLFLLYHSWRSGFFIKPSVAVDPYLSQLARMSLPVVIGTLVGFFGPIADKMLASFLPESSVTAIDYANRIKAIVLSIVFGPFLVFADLSFSAEAARGKLDSLLEALRRNLNVTSLVMFPTAFLLSALSVPVVSVFFQRGNLSGSDAAYIGYALAFYAPWLAQFGIGSLVSRTFYAQKDTRTPVIIGMIGVIVNVLLNLILIGPMGIGGLALATTVTSTAKTLYLIWTLSRKMGGLNLRLIAGEQLKLLGANLIAVAACLGLGHIWVFSTAAPFTTRVLQLVVYAFTGLSVLAALLMLFRSTSFQRARLEVFNKFGNRILRRG